MADDDENESGGNPDVVIHVEHEDADSPGNVIPEPAPVIVVPPAAPEPGSVPEWGVELIRRVDALESRTEDVEIEQAIESAVSAGEEAQLEEIAEELEEELEEAEEAAEEAEEAAEEAAEEIEPEPHRTHPLFRSWSEWRGNR